MKTYINGKNNDEKLSLTSILLALYISSLPIEATLTLGPLGSIHKYIGIVIMALIVVEKRGKINLTCIIKEKWYLLFAAWALLSLRWTTSESYSRVRTISTASVIFFVYICMMHRYTKREYAFIESSIISFGVLFVLILRFGLLSVANDVLGRSTLVINGAEIDPNNLAMSLSLAAIISLNRGLISNIRKNKVISYLASLIVIYGILLTGSRGGLMCVLVAIATLILCRFKTENTNRKIAIIAITILLLAVCYYMLLILPSSLTSRYSISAIIEDKGSARTLIWASAFRAFNEASVLRKFIGIGYGAFPFYIGPYYGIEVAAHNDYVQLLVEIGIVGLTFFLVMIGGEIYRFAKGRNYLALAIVVSLAISCISIEAVYKKSFWNILIICYIIRTLGTDTEIIESSHIRSHK